MSKDEFYNKLKNIGLTRRTFDEYANELNDFVKYYKNNNNNFIVPIFKRRKGNKYRNFITHLFIDKNTDILNILIKDDKNNYYIASIENDNYNLYDAKVKCDDNYIEKHRDKIKNGERIEDINKVLQYIDYQHIKNIYYEGRNNQYYGQNSFIIYMPFLETNKDKCLCSNPYCYCKTARYKYFAPLNIDKQDNIYIIDIITIYRIKEENKYPISI